MTRIGIRIVVVLMVAGSFGLVAGSTAGAAVNRWSTRGPGAGFVQALDVSPSDPNTLYAGAVAYPSRFGSGMYKSTDGGKSWDPIPVGLGDRNVTEVRVAPSSPDVVYAGTYSRAVYRSSDGGAHWVHTNWTDHADTSVDALAVDPSDPDTVFASAEYTDEPYGYAFFTTTDGGLSWTDISANVGYEFISSIAIDPTDPNTIYAGAGESGVLKSTDGGMTWQPAGNGLASIVSVVVIDPQDTSTIYAGAWDYSDSNVSGVYKSTDGGQTWALLDMTAFQQYRIPLDIAVDPKSPSTLYTSAQGPGHSQYGYYQGSVFKSTDGGQTWAAAHAGLFSEYAWRLAIDPVTPSTVYAGTVSGVFKTTDGAQTWSSASVGLRAADTEAVAVSPSAVYAGTANAGVFRSADGGVHWSPAREGLSGFDTVDSLAADPLAPGTLYAGTGNDQADGRGIDKSTDGGRSWVRVDNGLTNRNVRSVAVDGASRVYAGTNGGLFESTDGGGHWNLVLSSFVFAVATDPQLTDTAYAAAGTAGIYKTTDGGVTWATINNGLSGAGVTVVAVDPTQSLTLYAGADCYNLGEICLLKSEDGGASWQATDSGIGRTGVDSIVVDRTSPSTVYAATADLGVYQSTDGGVSWVPFDDGLPNNAVTSIAMDASGTLYSATAGSGVFVYRFG